MSEENKKKDELLAQVVASMLKEDYIDALKYQIERLKIEENREERDKIKREIRSLLKNYLNRLLPIDFEERPEEEQMLYIETAYKEFTTGESIVLDPDQSIAYGNYVFGILGRDFKEALEWGVKLIDAYRTKMGKEYYANSVRELIIRKFDPKLLPPEEEWKKSPVEEKVRMIKEAADKILRDRPFYL
jgi:hypothetical protein